MATVQNSPTLALSAQKSAERGHLARVRTAALSSVLFLIGLCVYGFNYYTLPLEERPYSPKHELLRPSGLIGINLGILGTVLFFIIFLYALRKIWPWLGRIGTAKHWMDFHVIAGVTAPFIIGFHASFKFRGIAGIAFWIMVAVALSGVIGRYLYNKIPRSVTAAELSLGELQKNEAELSIALAAQSIYTHEELEQVLRVPTPDHIRRIGPLFALVEMLAFDFRMPFQLAALRRASASSFGAKILSFGGLRAIANPEVERVVRLVRQKASLSRRLIFLNHTQKVFHLWHVVHRPFSYAFAVLAIMHIVVVTGLGFH
ncbi:hypothetical protein DYQ86_02035 [Acidobacteria bacterium AB60]|nr:hypothetical protein DYQ86_02035 [Acidobacteria bacterium AB60]